MVLALLRWPWVPPAAAIVLVAVAGQIGVGWLLCVLGVLGFAGAGVLVSLARDGRRARQAAASATRP
jgi:UPF0716 family protein affecting phage T7 exclusion